MGQFRLMAFVEALANVGLGYGITTLAQMQVFPLFGLGALGENLAIAAIFTVVSLARSYRPRRAFEAMRG